MSFRPGLTGLWQVSGRSNITDFEEVVKLDTQYIGEWSVKGDISILCKTAVGVFRNDGANIIGGVLFCIILEMQSCGLGFL